MKNKILLISFILASILSCNNRFKYEERVILYLEEVHRLFIKDETILIFISGNCGSCNERTIKFIQSLGNERKYENFNKYVIIPQSHIEFVPKIENKGFELLIDRKYQILRYGCNFDKNLLIHFNNHKKVKYWNWLYMEYFYDVSKKYNIEL